MTSATNTPRHAAAAPDRRWDGPVVVGIVAVLLVAVLQRSPVAGLGLALPDLHLAPGLAGVLTAAPAVCIAAAALLVPVLHARSTTVQLLVGSTGLQVLGLAVRAVDGIPALVAGSVLAYVGIAVAGIVLPAHIHQHHQQLAPRLTATVAATISAGVALTTATGHWANPLLLPIPVALLAFVLVLRPTSARRARHTAPSYNDSAADRPLLELARNPRTWALTVFCGIQSSLPIAMLSWEPTLFRHGGLTAEHAGGLVAVTMLVSVGAALTLGAATNAARSQTGGLAVMTGAGIAGLTGLLLAPAVVPWLWAGLLGIGMSCLSVALHLPKPNLRTHTTSDALVLGSIVQGGGYLIAATGPLAIALTGPTTGLALLIATGAVQLGLTAIVGRPHHIRPTTRQLPAPG